MVKAEIGRTIRSFFKNRSKTLATNPDLINFSSSDLAEIFTPPFISETAKLPAENTGGSNFVIREIQNIFLEIFSASSTNVISIKDIQKQLPLNSFKQFFESINANLTQSLSISVRSLAVIAVVGMLGYLFSESQVCIIVRLGLNSGTY